ncbi:hypothetical protein [Vreelandella venusta]|uniref:hypothetical protein n=1 Tax=Vreelandella venusta TaxID=44935 RepID=UPI001167A8F6|nr:hypothetical protein [Halomonas venusta]GEK52341.1 hypothetical protein HVE01_30620 [Halomonas venusta]
MSLLAGLTTNDSTIQAETDSVGGGGVVDSGIYHSNITMAFLTKSKGGALALNIHYKTAEGREGREQLWITSGDAKGNKNFYEDAQGNKKFLPGFNIANSLCLLTVGKQISEMVPEQKVVNVYSPEAGKEVPTQVDVLVELINQETYLAIQKQTVDKNVKADNGTYVPTGETREINVIDKVFRLRDKMTFAEISAQATEPHFFTTWESKFAGQVIDRTNKKAGATAGAPQRAALIGGGQPAANQPNGGAAAAAPKSLFG